MKNYVKSISVVSAAVFALTVFVSDANAQKGRNTSRASSTHSTPVRETRREVKVQREVKTYTTTKPAAPAKTFENKRVEQKPAQQKPAQQKPAQQKPAQQKPAITQKSPAQEKKPATKPAPKVVETKTKTVTTKVVTKTETQQPAPKTKPGQTKPAQTKPGQANNNSKKDQNTINQQKKPVDVKVRDNGTVVKTVDQGKGVSQRFTKSKNGTESVSTYKTVKLANGKEKKVQTSFVQKDSQGNVTAKREIKYSAGGKPLEAVQKRGDGSIKFKETYQYNKAGKPAGFARINASGKTIYKDTYHYNAKGQKNGYTRYGANNQKIYAENNSYRRYNGREYRTTTRGYYRGNTYITNNYNYHPYTYRWGRYSYNYYGYYTTGNFWLGVALYSIFTPYYYTNPYYNPWYTNPYVYTWGWASDPWYNYYGYYYRPYRSYRSYNYWMVDYTVGTYLSEYYTAQQLEAAEDRAAAATARANAAEAQLASTQATQAPQAENATSATATTSEPISEEVKEQIKVQVDAELAKRGTEKEEDRTVDVKTALEDAKRVYLISKELETTDSITGETCTLTSGDIIKPTQNDDGTANIIQDGKPIATLSVVTSKKDDCKPGSVVTISQEDLVEMNNDFNAKLDEAAVKAKDEFKIEAKK